MATTEADLGYLRRAIQLGANAKRRGNNPFGAVLIGAQGQLLAQSENTATSAMDPTGHAEMNLLRGLWLRAKEPTLKGATLYASGEPCPMCAAGIAWAGIGRVVYSVSTPRILQLLGPGFSLRAVDVIHDARPDVVVEGPVLEEVGEAVFGAR